MSKIIVTENPEKWNTDLNSGLLWVNPDQYFSDPQLQSASHVKVVNLCKSYAYQSLGYYVSLLAEARGHKILPAIRTIQDFRFPSIIKDDAQDFDDLIQQQFKNSASDRNEIYIYFGNTKESEFQKIGLLLFNLYQAPILKADFVKKEKWFLQSLKTVNLQEVSQNDREFLVKNVSNYLTGKSVIRKNYSRKSFDLAILTNPDDATPPSNPKAIQKFIKAADKVGFTVELITKNDFAKLIQFDALFIRETTNVNHHTFKFAKKASAEGLIVVDDPISILKCTNKVYLNELMLANGIPILQSQIIRKNQKLSTIDLWQYPLIVKLPDGAFSKGMEKVENPQELKSVLKLYFQKSDLLIAQDFIPTTFDWRVGIFNNKPLYVCKYFMAKDHWQIVNWKDTTDDRYGGFETLTVEQAPPKVVSLALKAARQIGNGFYGVDIKESRRKFYVVEVNDNPSVDEGVEDALLKNQLYISIMSEMFNRVLKKQ